MRLLCLFLLFPFIIYAQYPIGGSPYSITYNLNSDFQTYTLDSLDNQQLIQSEPSCLTGDSIYRCPNFYALYRPLNLNTNNSGSWVSVEDKKIWRLKITSNCFNVNLYLSNFHLEPGTFLYFYNEEKSIIQGAYTYYDNTDSVFRNPILLGNSIIIEYDSKNDLSDPNFVITYFVHGYRSGIWGGHALACENNVNCTDNNNYCNQIRSVAIYTIPFHFKTQDCSGNIIDTIREVQCSGTLINNTYNDFRNFFITARHCNFGITKINICNNQIDYGFYDFSNAMFYFNFESRRCEEIDIRYDILADFSLKGARLITYSNKFGDPDIVILELIKKIPLQFNIYYTGWSRKTENDFPDPQLVYLIHHPQGDLKKISYGNLLYNLGVPKYWWVQWYTNGGLVEQGSSGGGLFYDSCLIGTSSFTRGAINNCNNKLKPYFSQLYQCWDSCRPWLDPNTDNPQLYKGNDPIIACQWNISINGLLIPSATYREEKSDITFQASYRIDINDLYPTSIENLIGFSSDYTFRAKEIVISSDINREFIIKSGAKMDLISTQNPCESGGLCGFNY